MDLEERSGFERALVRAAATDSSARQILKQRLSEHVEQATREFMRLRQIPETRTRELLNVGMAPFDSVFKRYLKAGRIEDAEEGHFYSYYMWWMRQALVTYLAG